MEGDMDTDLNLTDAFEVNGFINLDDLLNNIIMLQVKFRCECCGGVFPMSGNRTLYQGWYYCFDCAGMWFNG
jgi:hypothetical protein